MNQQKQHAAIAQYSPLTAIALLISLQPDHCMATMLYLKRFRLFAGSTEKMMSGNDGFGSIKFGMTGILTNI